MTYVVVITGGIGSGKTAVSDQLQARGAAVVDTDVIARELTAAGGTAMPALIERFGPEIAASDGSLDRSRMRALAFEDPRSRRDLEAVLHPLIRAQAMQRVAQADGPYVVLVVPLLVESPAYVSLADRVLVVDCPEHVQIERTMRRSGLAREEVERIVRAQSSRQARLELADDVIVNDGDLSALTVAVERLHAFYLRAAAAKRAATSDPA